MPEEIEMKELQCIQMLTYRRPSVEMRCKGFSPDFLHAESANDDEMPVSYAFIYSKNAFKHKKGREGV